MQQGPGRSRALRRVSGDLCGDNRACGAGGCAGAAIRALLGVDLVDVAFADGVNGALGDAGAASDALFRNFVGHVSSLGSCVQAGLGGDGGANSFCPCWLMVL